jgi:hypothetical protein
MATEKLSKAYLWRKGDPPPKSHTGFVSFLRALLSRSARDRKRIAKIFEFARPEDLDKWVVGVHELSYALQKLAPAEAGNGPNAEYPWPHEAPTDCPAGFTFDIWTKLSETGRGRKLMLFVVRALERFEQYA